MCVCVCVQEWMYRTILKLHGEDGCDWIQGGDEDANLTDAGCEQEGPGGLSVFFAVAKHLQQQPIKSDLMAIIYIFWFGPCT